MGGQNFIWSCGLRLVSKSPCTGRKCVPKMTNWTSVDEVAKVQVVNPSCPSFAYIEGGSRVREA